VLRIAPAGGNIVLARTVAASMCAQLDFPIDQLDDLRLAVDEACALLVSASDGAEIDVSFHASPGTLSITASTRTAADQPPSPTSFSWLVITELCDQAACRLVDDRLIIELSSQRRSVEVS
jgi:serine/threonine-protein kinase RsbW